MTYRPKSTKRVSQPLADRMAEKAKARIEALAYAKSLYDANPRATFTSAAKEAANKHNVWWKDVQTQMASVCRKRIKSGRQCTGVNLDAFEDAKIWYEVFDLSLERAAKLASRFHKVRSGNIAWALRTFYGLKKRTYTQIADAAE